jgi:hypothetical protein
MPLWDFNKIPGLADLQKEVREKLYLIAPVPSGEISELALKFGKLAHEDATASLFLRGKGLYRPATFHLQQSVEKSAKGFGLLVSILRPEDLQQGVGHFSPIALTYDLGSFLNRVNIFYNEFVNINFEHLIEKHSFPMKWFLDIQKSLKTILAKVKPLDQKEYERSNSELRMPETKARMWKSTLELDRSNPLVSQALHSLENNVTKSGKSKMVRWLFKFAVGDSNLAKFYYETFSEAGSRIYHLSMLTAWHEKEPRYPPIKPADHWDPEAYTASSQFVQYQKRLIEETKRTADAIVRAADTIRKHSDS